MWRRAALGVALATPCTVRRPGSHPKATLPSKVRVLYVDHRPHEQIPRLGNRDTRHVTRRDPSWSNHDEIIYARAPLGSAPAVVRAREVVVHRREARGSRRGRGESRLRASSDYSTNSTTHSPPPRFQAAWEGAGTASARVLEALPVRQAPSASLCQRMHPGWREGRRRGEVEASRITRVLVVRLGRGFAVCWHRSAGYPAFKSLHRHQPDLPETQAGSSFSASGCQTPRQSAPRCWNAALPDRRATFVADHFPPTTSFRNLLRRGSRVGSIWSQPGVAECQTQGDSRAPPLKSSTPAGRAWRRGERWYSPGQCSLRPGDSGGTCANRFRFKLSPWPSASAPFTTHGPGGGRFLFQPTFSLRFRPGSEWRPTFGVRRSTPRWAISST